MQFLKLISLIFPPFPVGTGACCTRMLLRSCLLEGGQSPAESQGRLYLADLHHKFWGAFKCFLKLFEAVDGSSDPQEECLRSFQQSCWQLHPGNSSFLGFLRYLLLYPVWRSGYILNWQEATKFLFSFIHALNRRQQTAAAPESKEEENGSKSGITNKSLLTK